MIPYLRRAVRAAPYPRLVPNACRFCGATDRKITKEHVWPEWLADFLARPRSLAHAERWSSTSRRQAFRQPFLSATVKAFCDECNNGWMSELEAAAKPIVGPMVVDEVTDLDADAQRIVANWITVKGLVAAQTNASDQWIPEHHYRFVHHFRGGPPNTMMAWIGRRWDLADPELLGIGNVFAFHLMPVINAFPQFPIPPEIERYRREGHPLNGTIFQVAHFFALAIQHDWPGLQMRPKPGSKADGAFLQIWPTGPTVRWPPPRHIDDLGDTHKITRFFQMAPPLVPVYEP
jgi:hypothetical protein